MPLYTYSCRNGHSHDALVGRDVLSHPCPHCGLFGDRESIYRIGVTGFAHVPVSERGVSLKAFREASEELGYKYDRACDAAQQKLPEPRLWEAATSKANRLRKAGARDSSDVKLMT